MIAKISSCKALFAIILCGLVLLSSCTNISQSYTLNIYITSPIESLNPHRNRSVEEEYLAEFCEIGLVSASITDNSDIDGWNYEMASSIVDITATYQGRNALGITEDSGRVFQILLNPNACWEDGTPINAESYVRSMESLLNPSGQNSVAQSYVHSRVAVRNAARYFRSSMPVYNPVVTDSESEQDKNYSYNLDGVQTYLHFTSEDMVLCPGVSVESILRNGYIDRDLYQCIADQKNTWGYIPVTEENRSDVYSLACKVLAYFGLLYSEDSFKEMLFYDSGTVYPSLPFSEVGIQALSEYEVIYITENPVSMEELLPFLAENWIIHPDQYSTVTNSFVDEIPLSEYKSYGPYKIASIREGEQIILERNPYWYGYSDEKNTGMYESTAVHCQILTEYSEAEALFRRGELDILSADGQYRNVLRLSDKIQLNPDGVTVRDVAFLYTDYYWQLYMDFRKGRYSPEE